MAYVQVSGDFIPKRQKLKVFRLPLCLRMNACNGGQISNLCWENKKNDVISAHLMIYNGSNDISSVVKQIITEFTDQNFCCYLSVCPCTCNCAYVL